MTMADDEKWPLTQSEEMTRRIVWAATFGHVHWHVLHSSPLRGDVSRQGREKLHEFARNQAVGGADEAAAAYEEYIQECRKREYGDDD